MKIKAACFVLFLVLHLQIISFAQPVIIKGHVSAKKQDTLSLASLNSFADHVDFYSKWKILAKAKPDKMGNFRFEFNSVRQGAYFRLLMGETGIFYNAFLYPADSIFVEIGDSTNHFYGNGATTISYDDSCILKHFSTGLKTFMLSRDSFLNHEDSAENVQLTFIGRFAKREGWKPELREHVILDVDYMWKQTKLTYLWMHYAARHQPGFVKTDRFFFNFLTSYDLNNEKALNTIYYYLFLKELPPDLWSEKWENLNPEAKKSLASFKPVMQMKGGLAMIDSLYSGKIREIARGLYVGDMIYDLEYDKPNVKKVRLKFIDSLLDILKADTALYHNGIYKRMAGIRDKMRDLTNTQAPIFSLPDTSGNSLSLNEFRGKVVLLDFWEVGCVPCIQAIPNSNKLQEDLKGKDFTVVSICCHSPDKYWKLFINKFKWQGTHLASHNLTEDSYGVDGYPHYVLVDKAGIIRNPNAILNDDLKTEITTLLGEK